MTDETSNPWAEWAKQQGANPDGKYPVRILQMRKLHGKSEGNICGNCAHFIRKKMGAIYFKCDLTKITGGPATDWRVNWPACGKFEPDKGKTINAKS